MYHIGGYKMAQKAPGKAFRKGITIIELAQMFPNEEAARKWFEEIIWPDGLRYCPECGSVDTHECQHAKMPYRCRDCRKYFSVKTGTVMTGSPVPLLKWLYAIYLDVTSLKGVSSMKLHRDIGVTQKTAWHMQQRIREAFREEGGLLSGPVEIDETYVGGLKRKSTETSGVGPVAEEPERISWSASRTGPRTKSAPRSCPTQRRKRYTRSSPRTWPREPRSSRTRIVRIEDSTTTGP